jgi:cell division protein FtsB
MNNVLKYLFAVWAGLLIYSLLAFSFGPRGIMAYNHLRGEQTRQETNMERLWQINLELENTMSALLHDRDTLAVFARELGYAAPGERFIRIVGLGGYQQPVSAAGEVAFASRPQYIPNTIAMIIALFTGITILVSMLIFDVMKSLRGRIE